MTEPSRIRQAITGLAELHSKTLSSKAAELFEKALAGYTEDEILKALTRCLKDLAHFPTVAEVINHIQDGHPGPEEAWGMIPKDESQSGIWTEEMRQAYFSGAHRLVAEDPIAARMAFKESYVKFLSDARARRKKARWDLTLGHDMRGRQAIAAFAVDRGYLPSASVCHLLDNQKPSPALLSLIGAAVKALDDKTPGDSTGQQSREEVRRQLDEFVHKSRES